MLMHTVALSSRQNYTSKLFTGIYSGQLSLSPCRGRQIINSFGWWLKSFVVRTAVGRLDAAWNVCRHQANLVNSHHMSPLGAANSPVIIPACLSLNVKA